MSKLLPVSFHDDTIYVVDHNNEPYVPMRPLIENMGLAWVSQYSKLNHNRKRWGVMKIITPSQSGQQTTICIPLRKLPGFLATINPSKVRNELRSKIIAYQNECDDALWAYWSRQQQPPAQSDLADQLRLIVREEITAALAAPAPAPAPAPASSSSDASELASRSRARLHDMVAGLPMEQLWDAEHVLFLLSIGHRLNWPASELDFVKC